MLPQARASKEGCWSDGRLDLPVPVMLQHDIKDGHLGDARVASALEASYAAFAELRRVLRRQNNTFMTGIAWLK